MGSSLSGDRVVPDPWMGVSGRGYR